MRVSRAGCWRRLGLSLGVAFLALTPFAGRGLVPGIGTVGVVEAAAYEETASPVDADTESSPLEFRQMSPRGFGDLHNNVAWSMMWFKDKLYVGTNRDWFCWSLASMSSLPFLGWLYPNRDPDMDCTLDYHDLPLQAEIWRYDPAVEIWERVYQSPADVPIVESPGKYTARDIGYRNMTIFHEQDGTEALYISGVNAQMITEAAGPPRVLRTVDGEYFESIPQDPGTYLGEFTRASFRGAVEYKGRFFLVGSTVQGYGILMESADPKEGNDSFRQASPDKMPVWDPVVFNDYLYVALREPIEAFDEEPNSGVRKAGDEPPPWEDPTHHGYVIVKTKAEGEPPYDFDLVISHGAYAADPSASVISEFVYKGRLYVGTDKPAEIIRLNPDDTWDLVMGTPRETPDGWRYPLSGMDNGFDWPLNIHVYRMDQYDGVLYAGTADNTTRYRNVPLLGEATSAKQGFDLYSSPDGWHWTKLTRTGFDNPFQMGIRVFSSTPYGLFFGSFSFWEGCQIWLGTPVEAESAPGGDRGLAGLPLGSRIPFVLSAAADPGMPPSPPRRLLAECQGNRAVLSWVPGDSKGKRFHVYRRDLAGETAEAQEVGTTSESFFVDPALQPDRRYHYTVRAEGEKGLLSPASNLCPAPSLYPAVTFHSLEGRIRRNEREGGFVGSESASAVYGLLASARKDLEQGSLDGALQELKELCSTLERGEHAGIRPFHAEDLEILGHMLCRRASLCEQGLLDREDLL